MIHNMESINKLMDQTDNAALFIAASSGGDSANKFLKEKNTEMANDSKDILKTLNLLGFTKSFCEKYSVNTDVY